MATAEASNVVIDSVADLIIRDGEGAAIRFGDLYKDQKALIVFVRHFL
jgi:hypothetical protein